MKALFILSLLITISYTCTFAQYIVVENRIWSEALFASEGPTVETIHRTFFGDTILNNKIYKLVYGSWTEYPDEWHFLNQFIREENGKVYEANTKGVETLLYDFNLQAGDEYPVDWLLDPFIVDSVVIRNIQGEMLKHIYLSDESIQMVWVEKYGSYYGALNYIFISGGIIVLLCVEDQGDLIYQNETYNTCWLNGTYTTKNEIAINKLQLYNVRGNTVMVKNNEYQTGVISFFTLDGKEVLKEPISNSTTLLCLPLPGIFIYRFQLENGGVQTGKVVVK